MFFNSLKTPPTKIFTAQLSGKDLTTFRNEFKEEEPNYFQDNLIQFKALWQQWFLFVICNNQGVGQLDSLDSGKFTHSSPHRAY